MGDVAGVRTVVSSRVVIDAIAPTVGYISDGLLGGNRAEYDWQSLQWIACDGCTARPFLGSVTDVATQTSVVSALRRLSLLSHNRELREVSTSALSSESGGDLVIGASWGNFSDYDSGLTRIAFCVGSTRGVTLPPPLLPPSRDHS